MVDRLDSRADDQNFLDRVFDDAVERVEEGLSVSVADLLGDRRHLREQVEELVRLAQQVAVGRPQALPAIRGYTLLGELGHGGMGAVYLARQERLGGRAVALKLLPPAVALSSHARDRFRAEANAIARLHHPNIVAVHDVVEEAGVYAYAMEWVDGKSLAQLIDHLKEGHGGTKARKHEEGPSLADVRAFLGAPKGSLEDGSYGIFICRLGIAVARALGAVHQEGLLHRDVKPSNILLRRDGAPLLSDFGLARETGSTIHTQTGHFVGTPAYAAPEQLRGGREDLDVRTDVYGLGVTLYHALALRIPFRGQNTTEILRQIEAGAAQPLRRVNPHVPRDLQTIIAKAMDADRERRYASADELADDLERLLNLQPIKARPAGLVTRTVKLARRNRRALAGAVVGGLSALILAVAFGVYCFVVPGWVQGHLRDARLALLDSSAGDRVFITALRSPFGPFDGKAGTPQFSDEVAGTVLASYEAALRLAPTGRQIRLERDVVTLARDMSQQPGKPPAFSDELRRHAPRTIEYARRWIEAGRASPLQRQQLADASDVDLRCLGLLAFLCWDAVGGLEAWSELDLRQDPDALVEASLGQLYLAVGQPARAYPRLRNAFRAFPDAGFICVSLADAALQCGDVRKAELLLSRARGMERLDPTHGLERVEADLYAATGRDDLARERYEWLRQRGGNFVALYNYGRFLESRGKLSEAVRVYHEWVRDPRKIETLDRAFVAAAERWWGSLSPLNRWRVLRGTLDEDPGRPDAFIKLLRDYVASLEYLARLAVGEDQPGETAGAAGGGHKHPWSFLEEASLSAVARRMELNDLIRWFRFRGYPFLLKDLQVYAWLASEPGQATRIVDCLQRVWTGFCHLYRREANTMKAATPARWVSPTDRDIIVPSGFVVDVLSTEIDSPIGRLEAIRNPAYGDGVVAGRFCTGTVEVHRISESYAELLATASGFPVESAIRDVRFDTTGQFGNELYLSVTHAMPGDRLKYFIRTAVLRVSVNGQIAQVCALGSLDEPLSMDFDFSNATAGYLPGAYLKDIHSTFDQREGLYQVDGAFNATRLAADLVPPGRTHLNVWAIEFDPTGAYGSFLTMIDSAADSEDTTTVYQLLPDLSWVQLTAPVSTRERFYSDMAFSPGGSFGEILYVTECVTGTVMTVAPNGELAQFASGFDFVLAEGYCCGSITVADDGERMFVSDAKGIYRIRAVRPETEPLPRHVAQ